MRRAISLIATLLGQRSKVVGASSASQRVESIFDIDQLYAWERTC